MCIIRANAAVTIFSTVASSIFQYGLALKFPGTVFAGTIKIDVKCNDIRMLAAVFDSAQ
ncbi:MAG: hypothetical protein OYL97_10235 [Candidatus Poribacteria bacterium]|nr:hypothetical protein [Candidatus Poribacteria bacterium]